MNLYLIRHAIAAEAGTPGYEQDSQRPLTDKGRKKMRKIARGLNTLGLKLNLIITSPYLRARETAEILAVEFRLIDDKIIESAALTPGGDLAQLVEAINAHYSHLENIALVGHEPALSELTSILLTGLPEMALTFKKGGVCALTVDQFHYGQCAALEWLLTPAQLAQIG
jgi:phosphohistidine phosphatase